MSASEVSFSAQSTDSSMANVRGALHALHAKVAMLEKDRDTHSRAASEARAEHEAYKAQMERELNHERMQAAHRERDLLDDVARAEAEVASLREKMRQANLEPLPRRYGPSDAEVELDRKTAQQLEAEHGRIRDAEHEISKLQAERTVLESANNQLDTTIQSLLRSNEELLGMLRIQPRKATPPGNPASARANVTRIGSGGPMLATSVPRGGGGGSNRPPLTAAQAAPTYSSRPTSAAAQAGGGGGGGPLAHDPMRFRSPVPVYGGAANTSGRHHSSRSSSVQRETVTSYQHKRLKNQDAFDRLAQPRSCSRQRAGSPPHCAATSAGTSKNTARRFLTHELRAQANAALPH